MEKEQDKIDFKPLTSGLGFHPFSDGLPYAPVSKTPNTGTGATAAGRPTFFVPPSMVARVSVPVASVSPRSVPEKTNELQRPATQSPSAHLAETALQQFGFVYPIKRVFAFALDGALNLALAATALSFALIRENMEPDLLVNPGVILVSLLFFVLFNWAVMAASEIAFGTTVGKRIFGLALRGSTSAIFLRAFFFLPSFAFFGIGLFWAIFDKKHRCWHDLIVDLQPIEIARL